MQRWRAKLARLAPLVSLLSLAQTTNKTVTVTTTVTVAPEHRYVLSIEPRTMLWIAVGVVFGWVLYRLGKAIID